MVVPEEKEEDAEEVADTEVEVAVEVAIDVTIDVTKIEFLVEVGCRGRRAYSRADTCVTCKNNFT
jgi:hypothetical protein